MEQKTLIEKACEVMHDAYEAAATKNGWETQERFRKPWSDVPEANKETMRAAVGALVQFLSSSKEGAQEGKALTDGSEAFNDLVGGMVEAMYGADVTVEEDDAWDMAAQALRFLRDKGYLHPLGELTMDFVYVARFPLGDGSWTFFKRNPSDDPDGFTSEQRVTKTVAEVQEMLSAHLPKVSEQDWVSDRAKVMEVLQRVVDALDRHQRASTMDPECSIEENLEYNASFSETLAALAFAKNMGITTTAP